MIGIFRSCKSAMERWPLYRPRSLVTVEPVLFLFMFASFLSYPIFQQLLHCIICNQTPGCNCIRFGGTPSSWDEKNDGNQTCGVLPVVEQHVEEQTSYWILYNNLAKSLPAILVALVFGGMSDFYARRKPFILLPALGGAANALVVLLLWYTHTTSLPVYLVGSLLTGLLGSSTVFNFAVYSYTADISSPSKRTAKVGILESMTYFGATVSSAVGGVWVQNQGFAPPFWSILACQLAVVVYILVALPSSRPVTRTSGREGYIQISVDQSLGACSRVALAVVRNFLSFAKLMFTSLDMLLMITTFFIVEINFMAISDTVVVYALGKPLCWAPGLIGYYLAGKVLMNGIASILVLPLLSWCGLSDAGIILFGLLSGMAALLTMGSARVTWMMMLAPGIGAFRGCVVPCIRSSLSKLTPPHQQGVLFSGISVVESVCMLLASVVYNPIFSATQDITPGFCFYVMAAVLLVPLVLILWMQCRHTSGALRVAPASNMMASTDLDDKQSLLRPEASYPH